MDRNGELEGKIDELMCNIEDNLNQIEELEERVDKVIEYTDNVEKYVNEFDNEFENITRLNKTDVKFLMLAVALQCVRQYFTPLMLESSRLNDKQAAEKVKKDKESSDRHHRLYKPTLEEIIANPVPFDAIYGGKKFDLKLNGNNHRAKTLGHNPILGLVFGTANIATSTVTMYNFSSYHVKTGQILTGAKRDQITSHANTPKIFLEVEDKLISQGMDGKTIMIASLLKEIKHLQSDKDSIIGLHLPFVSAISPDLAQKLSKYGLDFTNLLSVSKQAVGSILVNFVISCLHGLCFNEKKDDQVIYKLKTKKIIAYSNLIATSSNILYVLFTKDLKRADIGGMMVTLYEVVSCVEMQKKLEEEFIANKWYEKIMEV